MNRRSILAAAMAFAGLTSAPVWANAEAAAVKSVAAQASVAGAQEVSLDAVVEAVRQATLSAQVPGAIVSLNVKAGDRVRAGQELLRIDASAAQQNVAGSTAQLEAAQANLRVASKELDRQKQLFQKQYISQGALERAQAQYDAAQAQVQAQQAQTRAAQTQTGFFSVRAHLNGVVFDVLQLLSAVWVPFGLLGSKLIGTRALWVATRRWPVLQDQRPCSIGGANHAEHGLPECCIDCG